MLAALASAAMPDAAVVGVRASEQENDTDARDGIDQAVVQDLRGHLYNVYAADDARGRRRLAGRVRAAQVVGRARELAGLGFSTDRVVAFQPGADDPERPSVLVTVHPEGVARSLELLTLDDCASVGTAIGAVHRLRPTFLTESGYPSYTTGQIRAQLTSWIKRLRQAGHVPGEITDSWTRILETEGLWSFMTCPVHGGYSDGDFIFSGSTITTITNWQEMQINDPARDLAWIFSKLDETHRNAVISAYGRILGNRLDDLIMLRANLWVQMAQVGDFIQALSQGDNARIMQFKAQVDHLAQQLGATMHCTRGYDAAPGANPSTVTVNTLLREDEARRRHATTPSSTQAASASTILDTTDERDVTGGAAQVVRQPVGDDRTDSHPIDAIGVIDADDTASRQIAASSSETIVIGIEERSDTTGQTAAARPDRGAAPSGRPANGPEAQTLLIPLLEREEQAMRDARAGLDQTHPATGDGSSPARTQG
ncbi:aminoglycoside phosphotransferase [Bifidobacterium italicum]|uniref:Aminoglycoside phosphotransferase n=2 Tax=Bifidobacterium italicum TaxID=1960968 RepID=A0A2A2EJS4_9BIFI|nr:aminoglycoside phosphotransferase [Bifidobacterium italicum]